MCTLYLDLSEVFSLATPLKWFGRGGEVHRLINNIQQVGQVFHLSGFGKLGSNHLVAVVRMHITMRKLSVMDKTTGFTCHTLDHGKYHRRMKKPDQYTRGELPVVSRSGCKLERRASSHPSLFISPSCWLQYVCCRRDHTLIDLLYTTYKWCCSVVAAGILLSNC